MPEAKRASRMPETTPLWMVPMVCPRSAGAASGRGERDEHLDHDGEQPDQHHPAEQHGGVRRGADDDERDRRQHGSGRRSACGGPRGRRAARSASGRRRRPIWVSVTTMPIAAGRDRRDPRHGVEQRLREIDVGDAQPAGDRRTAARSRGKVVVLRRGSPDVSRSGRRCILWVVIAHPLRIPIWSYDETSCVGAV